MAERDGLRNWVRKLPGVSKFAPPARSFQTSEQYWSDRYRAGDTSGAGSYGALAEYKATVLNELVADGEYETVLELGCGDGAQLALARYPSYVGVDISREIVARCSERFAADPAKRFIVAGSELLPTCELGLSLDVIYHLVEDEVFEQYMHDLLTHSRRAVILYTSDSDVFVPDRSEPAHIRHRPISRWMAQQGGWQLSRKVPNLYPWRADKPDSTSFADFYLFERI